MSSALDLSVKRLAERVGSVQAVIKKNEEEQQREKQRAVDAKERADKAFAEFRRALGESLNSISEVLKASKIHSSVVEPTPGQKFDLLGEPAEHLITLSFANPSEKDPARVAVVRFLRGRASPPALQEVLIVAFAPDETSALRRQQEAPLNFVMSAEVVEMWLGNIFDLV